MAKKKSKRPNLSQETLERARAELRGDFAEPVPAAPSIGNGAAVVEAKAKAVKRKEYETFSANDDAFELKHHFWKF